MQPEEDDTLRWGSVRFSALLAAVLLAGMSLVLAAVLDRSLGLAPSVLEAPRDGYIYEKGHYETSDGQTYVWVEGRYIPNREGHVWHPYVMERSGDKWHFRAGHWDDD